MSSKRLIGSRVILSMVQSTVSMLQEFFIPEVRKMRSIVFQQDGAFPHFAADVRRFQKGGLEEVVQFDGVRLNSARIFSMGTSEKRHLSNHHAKV